MKKFFKEVGWGIVTILIYGGLLFGFLLLLAIATHPLGTQ